MHRRHGGNRGGVNLSVLPDLGAYCNIIDENTWRMLKSKKNKCGSCGGPENKQYYSYTSEKPLKVKGTFKWGVKASKERDQ